jgi:hypothetical protein
LTKTPNIFIIGRISAPLGYFQFFRFFNLIKRNAAGFPAISRTRIAPKEEA